MSGFRVTPREGHLERLSRMYGYLKRQPDCSISFRTGIPDHESRDTPTEHEWINTVYGSNEEELPLDMPTPKGKPMRTTCYAHANLMHCLATGRSMSGIKHLLNETPIQWFSKKQNVVETATYGFEFMVARQATEQIIDIRYTLRMIGIPLDSPAWLIGDNQSIITSSTIPHSSLNKRHNALSYYRVQEAISARILYFIHVDGKNNPSDIMTKLLNWSKFWPLIQPLLFWIGETIEGTDATTSIAQVIANVKEQSASGLRGVTRSNYISPSEGSQRFSTSTSKSENPRRLINSSTRTAQQTYHASGTCSKYPNIFKMKNYSLNCNLYKCKDIFKLRITSMYNVKFEYLDSLKLKNLYGTK